jgi:hypothetical protein
VLSAKVTEAAIVQALETAEAVEPANLVITVRLVTVAEVFILHSLLTGVIHQDGLQVVEDQAATNAIHLEVLTQPQDTAD